MYLQIRATRCSLEFYISFSLNTYLGYGREASLIPFWDNFIIILFMRKCASNKLYIRNLPINHFWLSTRSPPHFLITVYRRTFYLHDHLNYLVLCWVLAQDAEYMAHIATGDMVATLRINKY
jgi:hypothetical protein